MTDRGLTPAEVAERVAAGAVNTVAGRTSRRLGEILVANVCTRFNAILGTLFAIILVVGPIQDALFGFVIVINTGIGVVQELRAKRALDRLAILNQARPQVRRDGRVGELPIDQVVVDDLIELGPGDQLVVDGTVTEAAGLEIDESLLTGESDPVAKRVGDEVLSGSYVVAGAGTYRATRVGSSAYAARLAQQASTFAMTRSELRAGIDRLLTWIAWLFAPITALTVYGQVGGGHSVAETLRGVVAALVALVPEGLVLLTGIAFAVGVLRLAGRRCLVQELPAIEGLARVDVVCTDKTGTLTEAGMRVDRIIALAEPPDPDPAVVLAALAAADPRPNASLLAIAQACPPAPDWPAERVAAFTSATKWSGVGFHDHGDWVLGAPDVLLAPGTPAVLRADAVAATGRRVLLLGRTSTPVDGTGAPGVVEPIALVSLEQRIRPDAAATIDYFTDQGVSVKILSGDSASAVGAVAAGLGMAGACADARSLPTERPALADAVLAGSAFGRVTPAQKQEIVQALRARGHAVAMTGDGVNDVLALKRADIGVAMGSGSPAARSVAQIVLLDNAFATLPLVVAEGRRVIGNIERVASLFLVKTVYSVVLAVLIGVVRLPFPLLPRHLTLIGSLTIGVPAFFLALAPNTDLVRAGLLRRVLRLAAPIGAVAGVATFVSYLLVRGGGTLAQQRTAVALTLFLVALWALVVLARPLTWWKAGLVACMAAGFALALAVPAARRFFDLDPADSGALVAAVLVALAAAAAIEGAWRLGRRRRGERRDRPVTIGPPPDGPTALSRPAAAADRGR